MHAWEPTELRFNLQDPVPRVLFILFCWWQKTRVFGEGGKPGGKQTCLKKQVVVYMALQEH